MIDAKPKIQGDQLNMAAFFWYLVKSYLSMQCTLLFTFSLDKSLFTRYQKKTAMFNWSTCNNECNIHGLNPSPPKKLFPYLRFRWC